MRARSPTRHNVVVLLRRDVFALKICAGNARTTHAHILKGVYEVNHLGACIRDIHMRCDIHTRT